MDIVGLEPDFQRHAGHHPVVEKAGHLGDCAVAAKVSEMRASATALAEEDVTFLYREPDAGKELLEPAGSDLGDGLG